MKIKKTKIKNKIKDVNSKLEEQLKIDYKNNKLTNFDVFLEIPKKANLKIMSFEKRIANLAIKQYELHKQIQILQQQNNESNLKQRSIKNQTITIEYKPELSNKTLINNLTMSLRFCRSSRNFN